MTIFIAGVLQPLENDPPMLNQLLMPMLIQALIHSGGYTHSTAIHTTPIHTTTTLAKSKSCFKWSPYITLHALKIPYTASKEGKQKNKKKIFQQIIKLKFCKLL
jgi:hypothetical protein